RGSLGEARTGAEPAEHVGHGLIDARAREAAAAVGGVDLRRSRARGARGAERVVIGVGVGDGLSRALAGVFGDGRRHPIHAEQGDGESQQEEEDGEHQGELDERLRLLLTHQYSLRWNELTVMEICVPITGHRSGVMTRIVSVMVAVIESAPGLRGPRPLAFAWVTAAPLRQWKMTVSVAPAITEPAGVPLLELSSA